MEATKEAPPAKDQSKVRFLRFESPLAGSTFAYAPGDVVEYGPEHSRDALRLIERGIAEEVTQKWAEEHAQKAGRTSVKKHRLPRPVETAVKPAAPEAAVRGPAVKLATTDQDWPG